MKGIIDMTDIIDMMEIKDMIAKDDIIVWTNAFSMSAIDTYIIAILLNSCSPFKSEIKPGGPYHLLPDERFIPPLRLSIWPVPRPSPRRGDLARCDPAPVFVETGSQGSQGSLKGLRQNNTFVQPI